MIKIYSKKDAHLFNNEIGIDTYKRKQLTGTSSYVIKGKKGDILLSFRTIGEKSVHIYANKSKCCVLTDDEILINKICDIDEKSGLEELFNFFIVLTGNDVALLQSLEDDIERLEEELLGSDHTTLNGLERLRGYRRDVLRKKRYYEQMEFLSDDLSACDDSFSFIDRKFDRLLCFICRIQDYLEQIRESYQSQIDLEQNVIMKVLTIAATIFMPLTLITGWYGMNLKIPEYNWNYGYLCVIVVSALIILAEILYFKKKKWM